jgi:ABC-type multidrug transport system ATPase subunit/ABC-type Na+ efflux pump permease subunit
LQGDLRHAPKVTLPPTDASRPAPEPPDPTAEPAIAMAGVSRHFGDVVALEDVSLVVRPGRIVGVIGPSGAGKTTAVRLLTGVLRPTTGTLRILGSDPTALPSRTRERMGLMPQHSTLYEDLTAFENLDFVASMYGLLYPRRRRRMQETLGILDLWDARHRRVGQLSGGMRRRVQLAAALVHEPDLIFLDEPTAGIDPLLRLTIWDELERLRDAGRTVVVTTQYVGEAERCDDVALIAEGRLLAFAAPEEMRRAAFGGEVLEVETEGIVDAAQLGHDDLVHDLVQVGPRTFHVTTSDAATATPSIIEAVDCRQRRGRHQRVPAVVRRCLRPAGHPGAGAAVGGRRGWIHRGDAAGGGGMTLIRAVLRVLAVTGKELAEVVRRPLALFSIVFGPFLVLALFGLGFAGPPPLRTELVIPEGSGLPTDPASYAPDTGPQIVISGIVGDPEVARAHLRARTVDLIVLAPADGRQRLERGEQAVLTVEYDSVSPFWATVASGAADRIASAANRRLTEQVLTKATAEARQAGRPLPPSADPKLLAAPTRAEVRDLAPTEPTILGFYGVAVLVLVVQHVAVTVSALSILQDRQRGAVDLFRVSPIRATELLVGKYLAFATISLLVAAVVLVLLVGGFGVPLLGPPEHVIVAIGLLVLASTGVGLLISLVSDSDRQAVQLALIILLASVFFSGLAIDRAHFTPLVQTISELLPTTQATDVMQDLLLRGAIRDPVRIAVLATMAGALFIIGLGWLRRELSPRS